MQKYNHQTYFIDDMRKIKFTVDENANGSSIRDFLRSFGVSTSLLKKLKHSDNAILLNGKFAKTIERMQTGDVLEITLDDSGVMPQKYENSGVAVAYEDEDVIVFNKPFNMPVHESRNHRGDSLANAAACYMENTSFRSVYRLDKNTSGLVLVAKNELAAAKLAGKVKKDYYAVCGGILKGEGTLDMPIRRIEESIIKRGVFEDGERAVTHWQSLKILDNASFLKLKLETGRTHQIRVHLSHIGHPLLGDELYEGDMSKIKRQALHLKKILFSHPISGKIIEVECDFPPDFKALII